MAYYLNFANGITFTRLCVFLGFFTWAMSADRGHFGLAMMSLVVFIFLILDFLDGFCARYFGLETDFGARFDAEVDALFTLLGAIVLVRYDIVHPLIFVVGLARYFVSPLKSILYGDLNKNQIRHNLGRYNFFLIAICYVVFPVLGIYRISSDLLTVALTLTTIVSFCYDFILLRQLKTTGLPLN